MSNFRDLLKRVKAEIKETTAEEVYQRLDHGRSFLILDVREEEEVRNGTVPGAAHLSRAHFESRVEDILPDKESEIVVYCAGGVRSAFAAKTLGELGYTDVVSMAGGFGRWKDEGRDWKTPQSLTSEQRN